MQAMREPHMLYRRIDLATKFGISLDRLRLYESAGILMPIPCGDYLCYSGELRVEVIAKAERLGFTFAETAALISEGVAQHPRCA